jgi:hypothetical protein
VRAVQKPFSPATELARHVLHVLLALTTGLTVQDLQDFIYKRRTGLDSRSGIGPAALVGFGEGSGATAAATWPYANSSTMGIGACGGTTMSFSRLSASARVSGFSTASTSNLSP